MLVTRKWAAEPSIGAWGSGSLLGLEPRCRRFESCRSDIPESLVARLARRADVCRRLLRNVHSSGK